MMAVARVVVVMWMNNERQELLPTITMVGQAVHGVYTSSISKGEKNSGQSLGCAIFTVR